MFIRCCRINYKSLNPASSCLVSMCIPHMHVTRMALSNNKLPHQTAWLALGSWGSFWRSVWCMKKERVLHIPHQYVAYLQAWTVLVACLSYPRTTPGATQEYKWNTNITCDNVAYQNIQEKKVSHRSLHYLQSMKCNCHMFCIPKNNARKMMDFGVNTSMVRRELWVKRGSRSSAWGLSKSLW